ncbi:hypothetical protein AMELA_G00234780 [Ameiurus melas]|uniref:Anaphylatoxin-like domain-containing protein n=1 Tax=Ameiurus melas TaxID=219545 RepID=A0A7J6A0I1_AMEME|nr:hypothetical protein AMELA_G00234780 [Ameiurus melas]
MHVDLVWLTATLLSFPLLTLCDPLNVLVAPNLLRIGTPERVFVEVQDYSGNDIEVKIIVKNHPKRNTELTSESVILKAANNFQALVNILIPDNKNFFSDDPLEKQYVYLQAQFPSGLLEKVSLVSFQSGYIFVQTDKSIYTPGTEVLPSFEVALKPSKSFFYVDDLDLQVDITAKYLFGKDVDGVAFVVFGVKRDDSKHPLAASLKRLPISKGEGRAVLTREMIQRSYPNIADLVGDSLYISVSVLTETGSEMAEAEKGGIQIVTSPYTIQFKKSPKFFHPGMSFDVTVYVTNPDQSPAENVGVLVKPGDVRGRTKSNGMAKVIVNTQGGDKVLQITARTAAPDIPDERQAENKMTAQAYTTKGNSSNYLHISIDAAELKIGDQININLIVNSSAQTQDFTYLILSKGQIVRVERFKRQGQSLVTLSLPVSKNLVPSFRVVAYYHIGASEVVSDSVWVDVTDTCMGKLKLDVKESLDFKKIFEPGDEFHLIVTGDPSAKVGLVAVDKAVFVLNKNRLTQTKIWDIIEKHDTGCTAGSGTNDMGVFYDAGLLFQSDKAGGTDIRTVGNYTGEQKKCCGDGLRPNRLGYTCERRATYILDGSECVQAFLDCCKEIQKHKDDQGELLHLARSICVADPYEIRVAKDFFIDLKLPYSAVRNEQLEIKAILYNFSNKKQKSEGVLTELQEQNLELNPSRVPGQEVSQTIEQAISGNFMGKLIVQPSGCGEQTMIYMTLPVIATHYLDTTKQWEGVGLQRRSEAIQHIQTGYARELTFRKPDDSYAAWLYRPSSTWLTAYVVKVFALASDLISIDENVLCGSIKWLILNAQMPDGEFKESAPVYHGNMVGGVQGNDADASLTAFVLIALQEANQLCGKLDGSLPESSTKAIAYLERRLPSLTNQYAVAISSYALANAGKFNRDRLLQISKGGAYWKVSGVHHFSLEATAYAVLALVKAKEFDAAGKAVNWLNRQSRPYGGYGTTQVG